MLRTKYCGDCISSVLNLLYAHNNFENDNKFMRPQPMVNYFETNQVIHKENIKHKQNKIINVYLLT